MSRLAVETIPCLGIRGTEPDSSNGLSESLFGCRAQPALIIAKLDILHVQGTFSTYGAFDHDGWPVSPRLDLDSPRKEHSCAFRGHGHATRGFGHLVGVTLESGL